MAQVQSLVKELRSHKPCNAAKKKKKNFFLRSKELIRIRVEIKEIKTKKKKTTTEKINETKSYFEKIS